MYCPRCGSQNEGQFYCRQCGSPLQPMDLPPRPPNYLVWSILTTLFCCQIGGIVAIVYSAKVDSAYNAGDYYGAEAASRSARGWNIGSLAVGGVIALGYLALVVLGVMAGVMS